MWHNDFSEEYKFLLRNLSEYGSKTSQQIDFLYNVDRQSELEKLREEYNLDQIAGEGSEVSKILNLFEWVKKNVIHDGAEVYEGERNSFEVLSKSKEGKGVNCRMVATVLCEVMLSMGYKSRFITGMPIGFDFKDCHVINVVYSNELNKWIYLDPSTGFFLKNINGDLLSYQEFREHIISDTEVRVVRTVELDELDDSEYIRYMTKNSFVLMSNNRFGFNIESDESDITRIYLSSKKYIPEATKTISKDNYVITEIYTNDDKAFWETL